MNIETLEEFDSYRTAGSSVQAEEIQNLTKDEQQVFYRLRIIRCVIG
jgi:hypothetical protein